MTAGSHPPDDDHAFRALDALRLRGHVASVPLGTGASFCMAVLMAWVMRDAAAQPALGLWLGALVGVLVWRNLLHWAQRRSAASDADAVARWLPWHRRTCAAHGLVWGLAAWLPLALDVGPRQPAMVVVMVGMSVGGMALLLFDLRASAGFALGVLVPSLLRLATDPAALQGGTVVALVAGCLLVLVMALAARRAEQQRLAMVCTERAERVSAQGARDAQALLRDVFDHAGLGISVFDADLRLTVWNDRVPEITGMDPALLRPGMPLIAALENLWDRGLVAPLPSGADRADDIRQRLALLHQPVPSVSRERRTDGRLTETRRNPLPGGGFVMFHADITEREAARRAAAEQQRMLALVLEHTEQGFWSIDNDLRTTDANPAMCRMLGLERAQLLGRSIYDFVDAANRAVFERNVALRAAGQAGSYEISLMRSDGQPVHCLNNATPLFDAAGRKIGALGLVSDISARKAAEEQARLAGEALAQKSDVLAWTLDSLVQGVLNVDPQGRCTAWNRRFLELLQLPPALMAGRPLLTEVLAWQLQQQAFGAQMELLDQAGRDNIAGWEAGVPQPQGHRYRRVRPDGTVLDVASHFAVDGSLVRTFTDVTASVAAETALIAARDEAERARVAAEGASAQAEAAREEAEAANRAKSDFLSRMSHELRTPLNAILGFAQLMQADADEPPAPGQRQRLDALLRGGHHLLALINDVLDVARIDGGQLQLQLQPVCIVRVMAEALALVEPLAQARGVLLVPAAGDADMPAGLVLADATRLRQVLLNLLTNAIKFNRPGGAVHIRLTAAGPRLRLEVADQGQGIGAEQLPRLFQAFERLDMDGAVEGTGIGLALSRSLVTLMHGTIGVHSTPGEGSVFWLELPRSDAAVPQPPGPPPVALPPGQGGRHDVLYIEDNEVNQVLMQGMLAHRPAITLRLAALPEEGVAMALAQPPDLVLLDIQLPGVDGYEVLRRLRAQPALAGTPVIAVSANAMPSDLAQAQEAGFTGYLTKPLDMQRLLATVDSALN